MNQKIAISALLNSEPNEQISFFMKPYRKRLGQRQIFELQTLFDSGIRFPQKQIRENLSKKLGLTPKTIQVWFQNRRQNIKLVPNLIKSDFQVISILHSLRKSLE